MKQLTSIASVTLNKDFVLIALLGTTSMSMQFVKNCLKIALLPTLEGSVQDALKDLQLKKVNVWRKCVISPCVLLLMLTKLNVLLALKDLIWRTDVVMKLMGIVQLGWRALENVQHATKGMK